VIRKWDLSALLKRQNELLDYAGEHWSKYNTANAVLNGIAYRQISDSFFLSGKLFYKLTEVKLDYN
jgi:glutamine cyclotransferase